MKEELNILAGRSIRDELPSPAIVRSSLGDDPTVLGSIALVLASKFASAN
jgi:hypothetical protein